VVRSSLTRQEAARLAEGVLVIQREKYRSCARLPLCYSLPSHRWQCFSALQRASVAGRLPCKERAGCTVVQASAKCIPLPRDAIACRTSHAPFICASRHALAFAVARARRRRRCSVAQKRKASARAVPACGARAERSLPRRCVGAADTCFAAARRAMPSNQKRVPQCFSARSMAEKSRLPCYAFYCCDGRQTARIRYENTSMASRRRPRC